MKYRCGFVTNSSSSSFIIKKEKSLNSVEEVFSYMKDLYIDWGKRRDEFIKYCKENEQFIVDEENYSVKLKDTKCFSDKWKQINNLLEKMFGFGLWSSLHYDINWTIECKTYKEFLTYQKKHNKYEGFPFIILDFSNNENDYEKREIFGWYFSCFDYDNDDISCDNCNQKEKCEHETKIIDVLNHKFAISSECGYIPESIVEILTEESILSCNHMG